MKNATMGVIVFSAGAAIGSAVTWIFVKKKYEKIAQEEIESVKEVFARRNDAESEQTETVTEETPVFDEEDYEAYESISQEYDYSTVPNIGSEKPYVISPEEFGELEEYDRISLTCYADKILTDENDCLIEDVERIVGLESLTHFGEYEDDSVFVRNDRLKCDYEILLDQRSYAEVLKQKPYLVEDE